MRLYSVYDSIAEKFGPLFEMDNDATAKRAFVNAIKDNINRQDFQLFCIGNWNIEEGKITVLKDGNSLVYQLSPLSYSADEIKQMDKVNEVLNESTV